MEIEAWLENKNKYKPHIFYIKVENKKRRIVIENQALQSFIKEFQDKVDWNYISAYQKLSESFIKKFKDKVNWDLISKYQNLSENFIKKFKHKLNDK